MGQKATEPFTTVHCTFSWKLRELRPDDFVLEPLVVPFLVIMFNELKNRFSQGRFANQDVVANQPRGSPHLGGEEIGGRYDIPLG